MPAFYKIDKERRLVLSSGSGILNLDEALSHFERLLADPEFDPTYSQLMDFSQVERFDFTAVDVQQMALRKIFSKESRRAILVPNDLAFGLARMYEILRENGGEHGVRVFRNLEAALEWALSGNEAP
jgi:hypothetical protein